MKKLLKVFMVLLMPLSLLVGCSSTSNQDQTNNTEKTVQIVNEKADAWREGELTINGTKIVMPLENASQLIAIGFTGDDLETTLPKRTYDNNIELKFPEGGKVVAKVINFYTEDHLVKDCKIESLVFEKENVNFDVIFPGEMTWDTSFDEIRETFGEPKLETEEKSKIIYGEAGGVRIEVNFSEDGKMERYMIMSTKSEI